MDLRGNLIHIFGKIPDYDIRVSVKAKIPPAITAPVKGVAVLFNIGEQGFIAGTLIHIGVTAKGMIREKEP
jgi:hypothetical protein